MTDWISAKDRFPNEEEMCRAYVRHKYGCEFIVMVDGADHSTTLYRTWDGFWVDDNREMYNVVAWQPLPEPRKDMEGIEKAPG